VSFGLSIKCHTILAAGIFNAFGHLTREMLIDPATFTSLSRSCSKSSSVVAKYIVAALTAFEDDMRTDEALESFVAFLSAAAKHGGARVW
jgi:hypothetical protein